MSRCGRAALRAALGATVAGAMFAAPALAASGPPTARASVQHLLRRFAFSASPEEVSAVVAGGGMAAWLTQQENWSAIGDSGSTLETPPAQLNANGSYKDYFVYERIVMQHLLLTPRQLQAKLELHWLDHFAVSLGTVADPAIMTHYEQTVRANALGNFATLLGAVAAEPAMLYWLGNNMNIGASPNENFAREVMQLYSTGINQLNMDGTPKLAANGAPLPNYTQADVQAIARAITGYRVAIDYSNLDPDTRFSVQFTPANHYHGAISFLGQSRTVPNSAAALAYVTNVLAHQPSTAPFMAHELLQRFVTETPSPAFVARIAKVWLNTEDAPDQIAQVITAIANDADFSTSYQGMLKQPVEYLLGALRQLPGTLQATSTSAPGAMLLWETAFLAQRLFYPPSVFSFYTPGDLATTVNTSTVLYRTSISANTVNGAAGQAGMDTYIDIPTLRERIGSTSQAAIAAYLLDATVDGGNPTLNQQVTSFLGATPTDNQIRGAMWLLLNDPLYAVN
jgi:uncharacterized protein (DUF1800 family)